ncbi:hypothetical protein B0T20DRAFT_112229 [Sordaria brevicollis]|uniref:N-acetyltransferase domain-containing protein n=1 Tax=Sordaria brevicollis TaxID=83679 RepID=A0AAE0NRX8_SORBR|nr:hypothetical protein B0T20DRAFT_112229 [Sordaria brevicollis]
MPAILEDPSAGTIHRVSGATPYPDPAHPSFPPTIVPRHVTLRDRQTVATVVPFASRHQVPDSLLHYLHDQFNKEIEGGDTYPMMDPMSFDRFADYWFQNFAGVMLLGQIERAEEIGDNKNWATECLGTFYIKPNYPGRSSHICNAGFIVTDASRNRGVGRLMGETYVDWAPKLGYTYSVFNLVYETNVASCKIWDGLGFKRIGRVKGAGNLKSYPDRLVDAIIFGRDLGDAAGSEELVSEERFDKIRYYLKYGRYPNGADRAEKSRLRSAATHYKLDGDVLMLKDKEVISDPERQYAIARDVHNQSHSGINRTTASIAERYHWSRIKETVSDVIKNCADCKETVKSSLSSTASQAQQNQHQNQHQPSLSDIMTTTSSGIKRPNLSPPIGASSSKRPSPATSPGFVTTGDTITIGNHSRTHPIPALPPEPPSHIDPYAPSSHHYNQSHSHFTDASGQQISILTSPSPGPMQVTPDTTANLATVQHNPFRLAAHESPMLPHHPSPPPQHHHSHYPSPYHSHPHHEPQHYSVATPSHQQQQQQPHHPHVSLPPIINPRVISQPGPPSTRTTTAHHHLPSDHGQHHNERDYAQHHQPPHQTQPNLFQPHRAPFHPPTQTHPAVYSQQQQQQNQVHPSQLHTPASTPSHQPSSYSTHHPLVFEAPRVHSTTSHTHIMQHDRQQQSQQYQPQHQYPTHQQQHHQVHHPQPQHHYHNLQQHQHQQHHGGPSSAASEPDTDSDTFQALLTVAGTEAMGMAHGVASESGSGNGGLDRLYGGTRGSGGVGHYDQIHDRLAERPEAAASEQRSGGGNSSAGAPQGGEDAYLEAFRGSPGTGEHGGDHQMGEEEADKDEQAGAVDDDDDMDDKDLDMLIDAGSEDEEDRGREDEPAIASRPDGEEEREQHQQLNATSNSNGNGDDTDMGGTHHHHHHHQQQHHSGTSLTSINYDNGNRNHIQEAAAVAAELVRGSKNQDTGGAADANDGSADSANIHGAPSAREDMQHIAGEAVPASELDGGGDNDFDMVLDDEAAGQGEGQRQDQDHDQHQHQDQDQHQDQNRGDRDHVQGHLNLDLADGMDITKESEPGSGYGNGHEHDRGQEHDADAAGLSAAASSTASSANPGSAPGSASDPVLIDSADAGPRSSSDAMDTTGTGTQHGTETGTTTASAPDSNDNSFGGNENLSSNGNDNSIDTKEKEKENDQGNVLNGGSSAASGATTATENGGNAATGSASASGTTGSGSVGKMDVSHLLSGDPVEDHERHGNTEDTK